MKILLVTMIIGGSLIATNGCRSRSVYIIDGKRFLTMTAAENYMDHMLISKQLAEVPSAQHYGGKLLIVLPSDRKLLDPSFTPVTGVAFPPRIHTKYHSFYLTICKSDFNALADGLRKSNMFDSVTLARCQNPNVYARENGYDYTLEYTEKSYVLTDIKSFGAIEIGLTRGLRYAVKNITWGMRELVGEKTFPAAPPPESMKLEKSRDGIEKQTKQRQDLYFD